jgi:chromate transporter
MAIAAALLVLALPNAYGQIGAIVLGGLIGWRVLPADTRAAHGEIAIRIAKPLAIAALILFFVLLAALPLLAAATQNHAVALVDSFYRSGSLVFGGGHVVLPLLQKEVVPPGWIGNDAFLAGYGAAQAVPGPLFTFSAYLGTMMRPTPNGWAGGLICLAAIYLPSFLLLIGVLPYWDALRRREGVQSALKGVNAAVVGLLLAALYNPVWTSAILGPADFGIGIAAFLLLVFWRVPPWQVVVLGAASAEALARFL